MKSQHIVMTIDEFHQMVRKLGWKYEYWNGRAHITPQWVNVVKTNVKVEPRTVSAPCEIRPVTEQDLANFIPAYVAGFRQAIDHCDYNLAQIKQAVTDHTNNFFAGERGVPLSASQVAVSRGHVVGGALIVERQNGRCLLDLLFVRPNWQRQGIATSLVAAALNHLHTEGRQELTSRFLLGNEQSRAWHHCFGFVDEVDAPLARAWYYNMQHNLPVLQSLGKLEGEDYRTYVATMECWKKQAETLEPFPNTLN